MQVWKFTTWRFICRGILYSFLNGLFYSAQLRFTQSSACTNNSSFLLLNSILLDTGVVPVFHSVQSLTSVQLFATLWTAVCQASLSFTISQSLLKLISIELVMPSNHFVLCHPLQSFPASGSFPMSQLFTSGGQTIGASASASALLMNSQFIDTSA